MRDHTYTRKLIPSQKEILITRKQTQNLKIKIIRKRQTKSRNLKPYINQTLIHTGMESKFQRNWGLPQIIEVHIWKQTSTLWCSKSFLCFTVVLASSLVLFVSKAIIIVFVVFFLKRIRVYYHMILYIWSLLPVRTRIQVISSSPELLCETYTC